MIKTPYLVNKIQLDNTFKALKPHLTTSNLPIKGSGFVPRGHRSSQKHQVESLEAFDLNGGTALKVGDLAVSLMDF